MTSIIDTNVILVANGSHDEVSPDCVKACAMRLQSIMTEQRIALDADFEILREYQNKTQPKNGNGPGDAFVKRALQNNANFERCDLVPITPNNDRGYEEFPDDARLANFDPPDRMFVAVAAVHQEHPPILQVADSKWLGWNAALADHDVHVDFLCPEDLERFRQNKFKG